MAEAEAEAEAESAGSHSAKKRHIENRKWTEEEDTKLINSLIIHGGRVWKEIAEKAGVQRSAKSCRIRWFSYLRPYIIPADFSPQEKELINRLHGICGNRWSQIAQYLPGRSKIDVKVYCCMQYKKMKLQNGVITQYLAARGSSSTTTSDHIIIPETKDFLSQFLKKEDAAGERFDYIIEQNNKEEQLSLELKIATPPT